MSRAKTATFVGFVGAALAAFVAVQTCSAPHPSTRVVAHEAPTVSSASSPAPPSSPEPAAVVTPPVASVQADASDANDDASLMARLRAVQDSDPVLAYQLAQEGQARFPQSPDAPERAALAVKALARQGKRSEARGAAEVMVNTYPNSQWAHEVEAHTGAHPYRNQASP